MDELNDAPDKLITKHLNGSEPINVEGYTDVVGVRKADLQSMVEDNDYEVIAQTEQEDIVLVGKKIVTPEVAPQ